MAGSLAATLLILPAQGAELKPTAVIAFDRYIHTSEAERAQYRHRGDFLSIDRLPPSEQAEAYAKLGAGNIYVAPVGGPGEGRPIEVPSGLIHDWTGTIFIPGARFREVVGLLQNYGNEQNIYRPEVQESKLLSQKGDTSEVYLRVYYKSVATAVLNVLSRNQFIRISDTQGEIQSCSTRINEVKNASSSSEIELPEGQGSGYLWRFNSYWRIEEKDRGVYLEIETIGLSRTVPSLLASIVEPLLGSIPRKVLSDLLNDTRAAAQAEPKNRASQTHWLPAVATPPAAPR